MNELKQMVLGLLLESMSGMVEQTISCLDLDGTIPEMSIIVHFTVLDRKHSVEYLEAIHQVAKMKMEGFYGETTAESTTLNRNGIYTTVVEKNNGRKSDKRKVQ